MESKDRLAIEGLFGKLAGIEANGEPRDRGAEAFIAERIAAQPSAPYYMAQTIIVQEQALDAAQQRIADLEAQLGAQRSDRASSSRVPSINPAAARNGADAPNGGAGGFLAGAVQTAMGVAGGVLLANMIGGLFRGDGAKASEPDKPEAPQEHAEAENDAEFEPASDDGGLFDFGDGGGFDI